MHVKHITAFGTLALALAVGACNRTAKDTRETATKTENKIADQAADLERKRNDEVSRLNERVIQLERDYANKSAEVASGKRTATSGLREEVKEDVNNVKQAVANLGTTTPDNWWGREEDAMRRTSDDIAADVKHFAPAFAVPAPTVAGETPATAPFTSRRDAFVTDMKGRIDAMDRALDNVKAKGARETELNDTKARVKKLGEDLDRLARASADDWWDVSKARVSDYVDRVEASVKRLDDNKPRTE